MRHREGAILEDECIGTGEAGIGRRIHAEIIEILAGEDLPRRVVVDDMALVHEEHAVTVAGELLDLLLDHDDRDPHLRELVHGMKDLLGALRVELGGRLIEDEDVRLHRKHGADGHALELTAGQVEGVPVAVLPDAEAAEYGLDAGADLLRREAEVLKTVADLVVDRVLRAAQLIERILEDEPDVAAELGHRRVPRIHATDRDGAAVRALVKLRDETEQRLAERALARAVLTGDADELALFDREADAVERELRRSRVTIFKILHFDERHDFLRFRNYAMLTIRGGPAL